MTTISKSLDKYTSNSNDTDFREWGSTVSANLDAVGLPRSTDSGQVNWATVTRATTGSAISGYEIRKLDDSLFSTAPVYIKIEYGNSSTPSIPGIYVSLGTGTNGAGTLTGLIGDRRQVNSSTTPTVGTFTSKLCCVDGFFGASMYRGINSSTTVPIFGFMVCRTMDDSGAFTADGLHTVWASSGNVPASMQSLNFLKGTKTIIGTVHSLCPTGQSSTLTDDTVPNFQAFRSYQLMPKMRPVGGVCVVYAPDVAAETQFQVAMVGTTPRNYIQCGPWFGNAQASGQGINFNLCMLWE